METLTFILPTAEEDTSELRSMCIFFLHWNQGSPLHESIVYSYVVANTIKYMMI